MSDAPGAGVILALLLLLVVGIVVALGLIGVLVLYSMGWELFGYAPTTHNAIVALFVLTLFDFVPRGSNE